MKWILSQMWEKSGYNMERRQMLEDFFRGLQEGSMLKIGQWIGVGCSIFVMTICMWLPYQAVGEDVRAYLFVSFYFGACEVFCYMSPYLRFKEGNKLCKITDKLKYLPISQKELWMFRFQKLLNFCVRVFLVFLVGQLFFALVFCNGLVWGNMLYPLILGLLIPLVIGSLMIR